MDPRDEALARVIARIGVLTRDFNARGAFPFKSLGLGRAAMNILFTLSHRDGTRVAELAESLGVTSGAVSQTVDTLKVAGLVTSEVSAQDGRGRILRLSDGARREVAAFESEYFAAVAHGFRALSTEDIMELDRILAAVEVGEQ